MLMSMTGYGLGEAQGNGLRVTMEMQSINRKQLEFSISLPREFESLEGALKSKCTQAFSRGRIQCRIRVTDLEGHESVRPKINASLAKACHEAFDQLAKELNLSQGSSLEWLARLPGVLTMESNLPNAEVAWDLLEQAADKAITDLLDMRRQEGSFLLQDLRSRILNLEEFVSQILPLTSELTQRHRQNLLKRLQEAGLETVDLDDDRPPLEAANDAGHQLALLVLVGVVEVFALRLADALGEALLHGLGDDAPEVLHVELVDALVVLDGHLPRVPVDGADQVLTLAEALAHGGGHRLLQGAEDDFPRDVLHRVERVDRLEEGLRVHGSRSGQ